MIGRFRNEAQRLAVRLLLGPSGEDPKGFLERAAILLPASMVLDSGIGPLLIHRWGRARARLSPKSGAWFDAIRDRVHADAVAMIQRERRWDRLLEDLHAAEHSVCLLKGAAARAEGRALPGRVAVDLDLLLPRIELERVEAFLLTRGYRLAQGFHTREEYLETHFHLPYSGPEGDVELHWSLSRIAPPGAIERIWSRTRVVRFHGRPIRVLAPEDRFLHACLHVSEHSFGGMGRWLGEVALERDQFDGEATARFEREAATWPIRPVRAPIALVESWRRSFGLSRGNEEGVGEGASRGLRLPVGVLTAAALAKGPAATPSAVAQESISLWLASGDSYPRALVTAWERFARSRLRGSATRGRQAE